MWLLNKKEYIKKADNKYGFIRGILEYERFKKDSNYETSYLISMDGTANVYQHVSCLTRDRNLAKSVNILKSDKPNDLYNDLLKDLSYLGMNLTRNTIKKSVMCYAYGLTAHGRLTYLKEELPNIPIDKVLILSEALIRKLKNKFPGVILVRSLLEELVLQRVKQSLPVKISNSFLEWTHVKYKVKKSTFSYTKPFSITRSKTRIYMLEPTNILDLRKMKTSITANYIHHLDSESLMWTVLEYKKLTNDKPIFTIHDCFMVPAPYKKDLFNCFKTSFLKIYRDKNVLKELYLNNKIVFDDNCLDNKHETFTIEELLKSDYILT